MQAGAAGRKPAVKSQTRRENLCNLHSSRARGMQPPNITRSMLVAEQLVGESRARIARRMAVGERLVVGSSSLLFLSAAVALAVLLPAQREFDPALVGGLLIGYALVSRVSFEVGNLFVVPEQLLLVPTLLLVPLPYVPLVVGTAAVLSRIPDVVSGAWGRDRWLGCVSDSWFVFGPTLVLAALAPGPPDWSKVGVYGLAFAVQVVVDLSWSLIRNALLDHTDTRAFILSYANIVRVDAILVPLAVIVAIAAHDEPLALLSIAPLVWLLRKFSEDRRERYDATLELNRAYRGTVMLLADVVEFDDRYTADHSRSVVELAQSVADRMGVDPDERQELEFAALLHDVGKIAIPKEILNKPAKLTEDEWRLMKTHTMEGQHMLDRVGGLLGRVGEIVRCCHERWDGAGYPDGISGEAIPLAARIVFTCDAYNAMTTDRPYRRGMSTAKALGELVNNSGTQFDPKVVSALIKVVEEGEPVSSGSDGIRALLASDRPTERSGALV